MSTKVSNIWINLLSSKMGQIKGKRNGSRRILLQNKLSLILKLGLEDSIVVELWGHRVFQKFVLDRFSCFLCLSVCLPG